MPDPDPTDDVLDNQIEIDDSDSSRLGDDEMAIDLQEQNMGRLAGAGVQAHEHFVQFSKVLDYSYEQDRKMVSLVESLGVREVTSRSGQEGIPIARTVNQ